jgi:hypothetical protein
LVKVELRNPIDVLTIAILIIDDLFSQGEGDLLRFEKTRLLACGAVI